MPSDLLTLREALEVVRQAQREMARIGDRRKWTQEDLVEVLAGAVRLADAIEAVGALTATTIDASDYLRRWRPERRSFYDGVVFTLGSVHHRLVTPQNYGLGKVGTDDR